LNAAQAMGYRLLSFAPEQIWNSPELVSGQIRACLGLGRPRDGR
jgi:hypothetical protein